MTLLDPKVDRNRFLPAKPFCLFVVSEVGHFEVMVFGIW